MEQKEQLVDDFSKGTAPSCESPLPTDHQKVVTCDQGSIRVAGCEFVLKEIRTVLS